MGCVSSSYDWDEGRKRWHFLEPGFYVICRLSFVSGLYEQLSTLYVRPNPHMSIGRTNIIKNSSTSLVKFSIIGPNPSRFDTLAAKRSTVEFKNFCNNLAAVVGANDQTSKSALDTFVFE